MRDFDTGFLEDPDFSALILSRKIRFKVKARDIVNAEHSSTGNPIARALRRKTGIDSIMVNGYTAVIGGSYFTLCRRARRLFWKFENGQLIKPKRLRVKIRAPETL